jgi:hypothetical protein
LIRFISSLLVHSPFPLCPYVVCISGTQWCALKRILQLRMSRPGLLWLSSLQTFQPLWSQEPNPLINPVLQTQRSFPLGNSNAVSPCSEDRGDKSVHVRTHASHNVCSCALLVSNQIQDCMCSFPSSLASASRSPMLKLQSRSLVWH